MTTTRITYTYCERSAGERVMHEVMPWISLATCVFLLAAAAWLAWNLLRGPRR